MPANQSQASPQVGLFVTCLVDLFRPRVGFAAVSLLEKAGCQVVVPESQTCCGQPAYNNGDELTATRIAKNTIRAFESFDYVVAPSGSCAGMIHEHYPRLFSDDGAWRARAQQLSQRTFELMAFLVDVRGWQGEDRELAATMTYHDSCSGLRELGIRSQPRQLLARLSGLALHEMVDSDVCCGFGGTFCVKYPDISTRMVDDKIGHCANTNADLVAGGDLGCLLNIAGRLSRQGSRQRVFHVAELLASGADGPAIGEPEDNSVKSSQKKADV